MNDLVKKKIADIILNMPPDYATEELLIMCKQIYEDAQNNVYEDHDEPFKVPFSEYVYEDNNQSR